MAPQPRRRATREVEDEYEPAEESDADEGSSEDEEDLAASDDELPGRAASPAAPSPAAQQREAAAQPSASGRETRRRQVESQHDFSAAELGPSQEEADFQMAMALSMQTEDVPARPAAGEPSAPPSAAGAESSGARAGPFAVEDLCDSDDDVPAAALSQHAQPSRAAAEQPEELGGLQGRFEFQHVVAAAAPAKKGRKRKNVQEVSVPHLEAVFDTIAAGKPTIGPEDMARVAAKMEVEGSDDDIAAAFEILDGRVFCNGRLSKNVFVEWMQYLIKS